MDDHIVDIGHPSAGKGQNRRSMGTALISVQKRINDWVDLLDDFFKRTVPKEVDGILKHSIWMRSRTNLTFPVALVLS